MHGRDWCIGFYQTSSLHSQCDGCGYTELFNAYHFKNSSVIGFISFPCLFLILRVLNSAMWPTKKLQHNKHQVIMETKEIQGFKTIEDETKVANTVHIELMSVWVKVTIRLLIQSNANSIMNVNTNRQLQITTFNNDTVYNMWCSVMTVTDNMWPALRKPGLRFKILKWYLCSYLNRTLH